MSLYWILLVLQCLDIGTTWYALDRVSGAYEANPLMRWLFGKVGVIAGLIGTKIAFIAGVYFLQPAYWGLVVLIGVYLAVIGNNAYQMVKK